MVSKVLLQNELELSCGLVKINTSHKIGLQWWVFLEQEYPNLESIAYSLFLGISPTGNEEDTRKLMRWISAKDNISACVATKKVFSIVKDYAHVWASFVSRYNIDIEGEGMHWHKFLALFDEMISGINMQEIVKIRAYKADTKDSREHRDAMHALQEEYSLEPRKERRKNGYDLTQEILARMRTESSNG